MTQQTTRSSVFSGSRRAADPSVSVTPAHNADQLCQVKQIILGKPYVSMPASEAASFWAARRRWGLEKGRQTRAAECAIARYRHTRGSAKAEALSKALRMIWRRASAEESGDRLPVLLRLVESAPTHLFWRAFLGLWPVCDNTWAHTPRLLAALRFHTRNGSPRRYLDDKGLTFLDGLPTVVTVYRGCSRVRIQGISWTTDETVARGFARGHRGLRVPVPVVVTAAIAKQHIFAVFADRKESEILLDPAKISNVQL